MTDNPTILITGASGQLGQIILDQLLEADAQNIIATTRSPEKLADYAAKGVEVRAADFDDPESLATAFAGADRLLLISTDALGVPGKRLNQHKAAVTAAQEAGVSHIAYTSLMNADNSPVTFAPDHDGTEKAIAATSMSYTILRENLYMELLIQELNMGLKSGHLYNARGEGKAAYVTRHDIARAAVADMTSSFDGRRTLDITGPVALSSAEIAELASTIIGEALKHVPVPLEGVIQGMVDAGVPQPVAEVFASFDTAIAQGKLSPASSAVEDLSGTKPTSIADFLTAHKGALLNAD